MSILYRILIFSGFIFVILMLGISIEAITHGSFSANTLLDTTAYILAGAKLADVADKLENNKKA